MMEKWISTWTGNAPRFHRRAQQAAAAAAGSIKGAAATAAGLIKGSADAVAASS